MLLIRNRHRPKTVGLCKAWHPSHHIYVLSTHMSLSVLELPTHYQLSKADAKGGNLTGHSFERLSIAHIIFEDWGISSAGEVVNRSNKHTHLKHVLLASQLRLRLFLHVITSPYLEAKRFGRGKDVSFSGQSENSPALSKAEPIHTWHWCCLSSTFCQSRRARHHSTALLPEHSSVCVLSYPPHVLAC